MSIVVESPAPPPAAPPADPVAPATLPRPAGTSSGAGWFALTVLVLSGVAPLAIMASTPITDASSDAWPLALVVTTVAGVRYAWIVAQGTRRLYELIFWLFTYVFLGLAPLTQMRADRYPGTTPALDTRLDGRAMLLVLVGTAAFAVGLALAGKGGRPIRTSVASGVATHRVLLLTAVAMALAVYYAGTLGVDVLFSSRAQRTAAEGRIWPDATVQAVVKAASTLPLIVAFVALVRRREDLRRAGRAAPVVLPVIVLAVLIVVVNPITSPRYVVGTAALGLVVAMGLTSTVQRTRLFALLLAAGLVLVFPYADITRRSTDDTSQLSQGPVQALSSSDFDAFGQLVNVVAYVRDEGNTQGGQLAGAALFWVPRSVWEDKPRDTGIVLAEYRGYTFRNLSAPLVGEFYLNGGWALLVGGMGLVGFAIRRLDRRALSGVGRAPGLGVLASVLPFYLIIVLRGSLLQSMAGLSVLVASAVALRGRQQDGPAVDARPTVQG